MCFYEEQRGNFVMNRSNQQKSFLLNISRYASDIIKMVDKAFRGPSNVQFGMLFIVFYKKL